MDSLHVFTLSDVPNSYRLVTTTGAKDRLVSRVPNCGIAGELVDEFRCLGHLRGVPNLDFHIGRTCQNRTLVQVTPLYAIDFSAMGRHNLDRVWLWSTHIPQSDVTIASRTEKLVLIALIEAYIKSRIWSRHLLDYVDSCLVDIQEGDCS